MSDNARKHRVGRRPSVASRKTKTGIRGCERLEARTLLSSVVVNTSADQVDPSGSKTVSLRDAFNMAASQQSDNVVDISFDPKVFASHKTINLSLGTLKETAQTSQSQIDTMHITGPAAGVTINGQGKSTVLDLDATIENSNGIGINLLGPISGAESYTLTNVTVTGSKGVGVWTGDNADDNESVTLTNCSITNNSGDGIESPACTVTNSTISGNAWGINNATGGAQGYGSDALLTDVTISGNALGGVTSDVITATNSTISGNKGYGLKYHNFVAPGSPASEADGILTNVTIANNAGGIDTTAVPTQGSSHNDNPGPYISIGNSIVAGNTTSSIHTDVAGPVESLGHNLIGIASGKNALNGAGGWVSSDLVGTASKPENPQLSSLGNFGGSTSTMLPAASSPVVDAGSNALIPSGITTDQRGNARKFGPSVDIGAVEVRYCTISGEVFNDANKNGVISTGEKGLASQKVFLDLNNNGKLDAGEPLATTNASGIFTISKIPAGTFRVEWIAAAGFKIIAPSNGYRTTTVTPGQSLGGQNFALDVLTKRTGTAIGTAGSNGNTIAKATDGNLSTYFDSNTANGNWVGLDLGSSKSVSQLAFAPRSGDGSRMVGGKIQVSTSANFTTGVSTIYTIGSAPVSGSLTIVNLASTATGRYFRYLSPNASHGDIAEFQLFG
jgi:hypothetical protein